MRPSVPAQVDLAIVGSGLAAAAAAAVAARLGAQVVLLVRRGLVHGFGEVIDPRGLLALDRMGLRGRVSSALGASVDRMHLRWPPERDWVRTFPGPGTIASATRLTETLRECAAAAGAWIVETDGTMAGSSLRACHRSWDLCVPSGGSSIAVDWVVDATGKGDWAQAHGLERQSVYRHMAVHVVGHRTGASGREPASMLVSASADGWCYRLVYPGPQIAGAVFRREGALKPGQVQALASGLMRMEGGVACAALSARVVRCELAFARRCDGPGWIAIGGAALELDPLSGQGMGWALESAWQGVQACLQETEPASRLVRYREIWAGRVRMAHQAAARHHGEAVKAFGTPYWLESLEKVRGAVLPPSVPAISIT